MTVGNVESSSQYVDRLPDPSGYYDWIPKPERYALDPKVLINQLDERVIRIEQVAGKYYGTLEGKVVASNDASSLRIHASGDDLYHLFVKPMDFFRSHEQFFIKSTPLRRRRYVTEEALEWRVKTHSMFTKAVGKGLIPVNEIPYWKEQGGVTIARYLGIRLGLTFPTTAEEVLNGLNGL